MKLEPLYLALVDAISRAQDERERAEDRTRRPAGELTEREQSTLLGLRTRAGALSNAYRALEAQHTAYPENKAPYLEVMRELRDDAHEQFLRYRREVGLPEEELEDRAGAPSGASVFFVPAEISPIWGMRPSAVAPYSASTTQDRASAISPLPADAVLLFCTEDVPTSRCQSLGLLSYFPQRLGAGTGVPYPTGHGFCPAIEPAQVGSAQLGNPGPFGSGTARKYQAVAPFGP